MSAHPWHKRYHSDALTGYSGLSLEQRGAYTTVLDLLYDRGEIEIADNPRLLAGALDCSQRKWEAIRRELLAKGKLEIVDGMLTNRRYLREKVKAARVSEKRAEAGSKGGKARANAKQLPETPAQPQLVLDPRKHAENGSASMLNQLSSSDGERAKSLENNGADLAIAQQSSSYTRATPEARSQIEGITTPSTLSVSGENRASDDDDVSGKRELPLDLIGKVETLGEKAGLNLTIPSKLLAATDQLKEWTEAGIDFAGTIVPTIEARTRESPSVPIHSLRYFDPAVRKAHALSKDAKAPAPAKPRQPLPAIAASDGGDERVARFRARLKYAVGERAYSERYGPEHVAIDVVDGRFLRVRFRSSAEAGLVTTGPHRGDFNAAAESLGLGFKGEALR